MTRISPYAIALVQNALLASFWRLEALRAFLRRSGVATAALANLQRGTTKRQYLDWLFPQLERQEKGTALLRQMAKTLAEQESFPDLLGWEDSALKISAAREAVANLREHLAREQCAKTDEAERRRIRELAEQQRASNASHTARLKSLDERLKHLLAKIGTQEGGYDFQDWFADLVDLFELDQKRPYRTEGREIDGSVTVEGTTYLLSLRFTSTPEGPQAVSAFRDRVRRGADNTMGLFVSMSGFTPIAVREAAGPQTPILLIDHNHIYCVLGAVHSLEDVVLRVRRHAARTGQAYLALSDFSK